MADLAKRITMAGAEVLTYGVGGDETANTLPAYSEHRVTVVSGSLAIAYKDNEQLSDAAFAAIEAGKTSATQNVYNLKGVGQFEFTATGTTVFVVRSYN